MWWALISCPSQVRVKSPVVLLDLCREAMTAAAQEAAAVEILDILISETKVGYWRVGSWD